MRVPVTHLQELDQATARSFRQSVGGGDVARDHQRFPGGVVHGKRELRGGRERGGVHAHQGIDVLGQELLDKVLELERSLDEVAQSGSDCLWPIAHHTRGERRRIGEACVEFTQAGKLGADVRQFGAGISLLFAELGECRDRDIERVFGFLAALAGIFQLRLELDGAIAAMLERGSELIDLVVNLFETLGIHAVLDLGVGKGLPDLHEFERGVVGIALGVAHGTRERGDELIELDASSMQLVGGGLEGGDVDPGDLCRGTLLIELAIDIEQFLKRALALMLRGREGAAHLRKARDHVAALLLEQAHIGADAPNDVLHMAALLTQIAYEQTLLLKHDLELLKLSLLFGEAVARKLERRGALTRGGFEVNPLGLQLTELIDGEDLSQLVGARGQVLVLAGTIDLALEGLELTRNLTINVTGTGKVLVHALDFAQRTLLAALMLGDASGLLDEAATFLGATLKDRIELALGNDGVRVLAQARIMQDVLNVHQAAGARVDEVFAFARTVHATRDRDLVEIDGQHVIGIVEYERDLRDANRLARGRTGEDDVLHGLTTQLLGALLAQDPQDGIGNIGFTRSVRADDDRQTRLERHVSAVREGFEPLEGQRLQIHATPCYPSFFFKMTPLVV